LPVFVCGQKVCNREGLEAILRIVNEGGPTTPAGPYQDLGAQGMGEPHHVAAAIRAVGQTCLHFRLL
jgi:hypothetical protein